MDDAVVKIERTCVYADVRRLCSEVGRGRNIGLHNLFRLYTDGGKSDASRALYLFRNVGRYGRGEDGTPGKRRAIDFPSHVRCWRSSFVFPKRPASVDTTDLLSHPARHSRNSLMKPTFRPPIFRVMPLCFTVFDRTFAPTCDQRNNCATGRKNIRVTFHQICYFERNAALHETSG